MRRSLSSVQGQKVKRVKELSIEFQEEGLACAKHCDMRVQEVVSSLQWSEREGMWRRNGLE